MDNTLKYVSTGTTSAICMMLAIKYLIEIPFTQNSLVSISVVLFILLGILAVQLYISSLQLSQQYKKQSK